LLLQARWLVLLQLLLLLRVSLLPLLLLLCQLLS
jgi:hypothetical protein